jgi:methyl-accepting chemotaxis protein
MNSMNAIADDSKKIEEIIAVIESIAFQTNLLALNAAVEAARAGEQGKGFAVVAEAVRTLSQRTSSASKDISALIRASVEKVSLGSSQAKESGQVLEQVLVAIKKVSDINNEIATANAEQSNGISQISQAMNQLDQATQINAATSEEAAASAEELSAQAVQMRNVVKLLNKAINGGGREAMNASASPASMKASAQRPSSVIPFTPKPKTMADFESPQWAGRKVSNTEGF